MAAGGIERPITPATAIKVSTYGSELKRSGVELACSKYWGKRSPRALEKPNRRHAAKAPNGRQFPKIKAAMAMKPRPPVMFWSKRRTTSRERYAPPSAASAPETRTAAYRSLHRVKKDVVVLDGKAVLIPDAKDQLGVVIVLGARIIQPFLPPCRSFFFECAPVGFCRFGIELGH